MTNKELEKEVNGLNEKFDKMLMVLKRYAEQCDIDIKELQEQKFKVGDRVIHKDYPNEIFTITLIDDTSIDAIDKDGETLTCWDDRDFELYTKPFWVFTEDEKTILRNLPQEYKWIVRDEDKTLSIFTEVPTKDIYRNEWCNDEFGGEWKYIAMFNHLFQSIQWTDTEPCNFREFI